MASSSQSSPRCQSLVLDAGPLLSLSPIRGLAEKYYTVPQVLAELKDERAREHFERLGMQAGVRIEVRSPDAASLAHVVQFAKRTGDYAVLSHVDLSLVALTYALTTASEEAAQNTTGPSEAGKSEDDGHVETSEAGKSDVSEHVSAAGASGALDTTGTSEAGKNDVSDDGHQLGVEEREPFASFSDAEPILDTSENPDHNVDAPLYDDPSDDDDDDGEGEWITPSNAALHKSRALELLPDSGARRRNEAKKKDAIVSVGCMTTDFAMQNVLLQMGLGLVSVEGKRIERLKTWVLRCHACFKICKDPSKKFCPSCGNPTLLRTSVTIGAPGDAHSVQIHLKKNFQYKNRGTIYPIPSPKPGSAKTGPGEGLILREDQLEYVRAQKRADAKRGREERKMVKALFAQDNNNEYGVAVGSWMDPDWIPEMMSGGKGRKMGTGDEMPVIGYGRKNPNERRRRK